MTTLRMNDTTRLRGRGARGAGDQVSATIPLELQLVRSLASLARGISSNGKLHASALGQAGDLGSKLISRLRQGDAATLRQVASSAWIDPHIRCGLIQLASLAVRELTSSATQKERPINSGHWRAIFRCAVSLVGKLRNDSSPQVALPETPEHLQAEVAWLLVRTHMPAAVASLLAVHAAAAVAAGEEAAVVEAQATEGALGAASGQQGAVSASGPGVGTDANDVRLERRREQIAQWAEAVEAASTVLLSIVGYVCTVTAASCSWMAPSDGGSSSGNPSSLSFTSPPSAAAAATSAGPPAAVATAAAEASTTAVAAVRLLRCLWGSGLVEHTARSVLLLNAAVVAEGFQNGMAEDSEGQILEDLGMAIMDVQVCVALLAQLRSSRAVAATVAASARGEVAEVAGGARAAAAAVVTVADAILSGPCLQHFMRVHIVSQLYDTDHGSGGYGGGADSGGLYAMQHAVHLKQLHDLTGCFMGTDVNGGLIMGNARLMHSFSAGWATNNILDLWRASLLISPQPQPPSKLALPPLELAPPSPPPPPLLPLSGVAPPLPQQQQQQKQQKQQKQKQEPPGSGAAAASCGEGGGRAGDGDETVNSNMGTSTSETICSTNSTSFDTVASGAPSSSSSSSTRNAVFDPLVAPFPVRPCSRRALHAVCWRLAAVANTSWEEQRRLPMQGPAGGEPLAASSNIPTLDAAGASGIQIHQHFRPAVCMDVASRALLCALAAVGGGEAGAVEVWAAVVRTVHNAISCGRAEREGCREGKGSLLLQLLLAPSLPDLQDLLPRLAPAASSPRQGSFVLNLPPAPPPPSLAAALSCGFTSCLERLLRCCGRAVGEPPLVAIWDLRVLTHLLLRPGRLAALFAYGEPRQVAALVVTGAKLLRQQILGVRGVRMDVRNSMLCDICGHLDAWGDVVRQLKGWLQWQQQIQQQQQQQQQRQQQVGEQGPEWDEGSQECGGDSAGRMHMATVGATASPGPTISSSAGSSSSSSAGSSSSSAGSSSGSSSSNDVITTCAGASCASSSTSGGPCSPTPSSRLSLAASFALSVWIPTLTQASGELLRAAGMMSYIAAYGTSQPQQARMVKQGEALALGASSRAACLALAWVPPLALAYLNRRTAAATGAGTAAAAASGVGPVAATMSGSGSGACASTAAVAPLAASPAAGAAGSLFEAGGSWEHLLLSEANMTLNLRAQVLMACDPRSIPLTEQAHRCLVEALLSMAVAFPAAMRAFLVSSAPETQTTFGEQLTELLQEHMTEGRGGGSSSSGSAGGSSSGSAGGSSSSSAGGSSSSGSRPRLVGRDETCRLVDMLGRLVAGQEPTEEDEAWVRQGSGMEWAMKLAALLPPPNVAAAAMGLPVCSFPWCTRLEGDSEVGVRLLGCGRCSGSVAYCSKECQMAHWHGGHKAQCGPRPAAG